MNVDMAKRLADRRRNAGLTQEGLAEKLDVSRQAVSKWERSESSPDTDNLIALAHLYGVSLDELLYGDIDVASASNDEQAENGGTTTTAANESAKAAGETEAQPDDAKDDGIRSARPYISHQGIHIDDGDDHVHINWRDGVNVLDREGNSVHVGWDGVHVNDRDYDNLRQANEAIGHGHFPGCPQTALGKAWMRFPFPLAVILAYILAGVFWGEWGMGLFLFAAIPLYYMVGNLIDSGRLGAFLAGFYPLAVVVAFCYMAFVQNMAHPAWVLFLTIPLAEWLIAAVSRWWRGRKNENREAS